MRLTKPQTQRALAALTGARDLLSHRAGWIQSLPSNGYGGYCLTGALAASTPDADAERHAREVLWQAIRRRHPRTRAYRVQSWNDSPSRKHGEVLQALDDAIALMREQHANCKVVPER